MTVHRDAFTNFSGDCPAPLSLETLVVIEQLLARMLGTLRDRITAPQRADAGDLEYESWLRGRDR